MTGLVDRGQETAGGAIEVEAAVLPGCALTQSREPFPHGEADQLHPAERAGCGFKHHLRGQQASLRETRADSG